MAVPFSNGADWVCVEAWHDGRLQQFRTQILAQGEGELMVSMPMVGLRPADIHVGDVTQVVVATPEGMYRFKSKVVRCQNRQRAHVILSVPANPTPIQRRAYARLRERIAVAFRYRSSESTSDLTTLELVTKDFSAGGLRGTVHRGLTMWPPSPKTVGIVEFRLPGDEYVFRFQGSVVMCMKEEQTNKTELFIQFLGVKEGDRTRLERYVSLRLARRR